MTEKRLVTPRDYGLPDKFTAWRPGQHDIVDSIRANQKRLSMLSAPVGSGKSAIAIASGVGRRTLYLCTTKQLQDQLQADFPNAVVLKGRGNYVCLKDPNNLTAEHCTRAKSKRDCKKCGYSGWCEGHRNSDYNGRCACESECEYLCTKEAALAASLAVLNIQLFMTEANMVGGFSGWPYMVIDEADLLENALMSYVDLTITKKNIETLQLDPPKYRTKPESWIEWMRDYAIPKCENTLESLQGYWTPSNLKLETTISRLLSKLRFAAHEIPTGNWVFIPDEERWSFKPVFVNKYAANALWQHCKQVLMMSATLVNPPQLCRDIGFDRNEAEVFEMGSSFPIESRRVIFRPAAYVTFKTFEHEFPKVVAGLDDVLDAHPDVKALVHAVSYTNAKEILRLSRHRGRMITHENSTTKDEALDRFKLATYPAVMVSPSMDRGVDLPGEQCFPPDTLVRTSCGYVPISEIKVGDRVFTHNRRFCRVVAVNSRHYCGELVSIKTYGGMTCLMTPEHPILTTVFSSRTSEHFWKNGGKKKLVSLVWQPAKDITKKTMLVYPIGSRKRGFKQLGVSYITGHRGYDKENHAQVRSHWDETADFWWLVGIYAAEGSVTRFNGKRHSEGHPRVHSQIQFDFGSHEKDTLAERTSQLINTVLGNSKPEPRVYGGGCVISIKNDAFGKWLERNIGRGARNKRVPQRLMDSGSDEFKSAFIDGLFAGDGHDNGEGYRELTLASMSLCCDVKDMLLDLGFSARAVLKASGYWSVVWSSSERYSMIVRHRTTQQPKYILTKPIEVSNVLYNGLVYNLQVDQDESYSLLSLCVHNCRVIVLTKVPYASLKDKQIAARVYGAKDGNEWYATNTIRSIVQASGRATRSADDWSVTYILDGQFAKLYWTYAKAFPQWWRDALVMNEASAETEEE